MVFPWFSWQKQHFGPTFSRKRWRPGRRARSQGDQKPHRGAEATRYFATAWRGWEEITSKLWVKPHLGGLYMFIPPIYGDL